MSRREPLELTRVPLEGVHVVEASAGTGKTYTITGLVLRLLTEADVPLDQILAVTFTNAATAELAERIRLRVREAAELLRSLDGRALPGAPPSDPALARLLTLPDARVVLARLERAEKNADAAAVFTLHGFSSRMLAQHSFECGVREDVEVLDDADLRERLVRDFWLRELSTLPLEQYRLLAAGGLVPLLKLAKLAAGAHELAVAPGSPAPPLAEALAREREARTAARAEHARSAAGLEAALAVHKGLNRRSYTKANVSRWLAHVGAHLASDRPAFEYPDLESARLTPEGVRGASGGALLEHPLLAALGAYFEAVTGLDDAVAGARRELARRLAEEIVQRLTREHSAAGSRSYDGLLTELLAALRRPVAGAQLAAAIRARFRFALIDEFQDTDPVQYEIFERLFAVPAPGRGLFLIGDPKQSIYAFRGADLHTYLSAADESGRASKVWTLGTSYRASPGLVAAQNALFQGPRLPFGRSGVHYEPVEARPGAQDRLVARDGTTLPGLSVLRHEERDRLALTAALVAQFLASGHTLGGAPLTARSVAVLTRSNADAARLHQLLQVRGVPAVLRGDRSVLSSPEAEELALVLAALLEPADRRIGRSALATRLLGLSAEALAALEDAPTELERWTGLLRDHGELWRARGVAAALHSLAAAVELLPRSLAELDGERRVTNFRHLVELLHAAEGRRHLAPLRLLGWLRDATRGEDDVAAEERQLRLERDDDAVTLTTVHRSKGLEYDVVFLPALGAALGNAPSAPYRYHDENGRALLEVVTRPETAELALLEEREERLRVAYVALTRARHHVAVLAPESGGATVLDYLLLEGQAETAPGLGPFAERFKKPSSEERAAALTALAGRARGSVEVLTPAETTARASACGGALALLGQRSGLTALLEPPRVTVRTDGPRTSSFSGMTRERDARPLSQAARSGLDRDELGAGGAASAGPAARAAVLLADFPRGAAAGDALHAALEHAPFAEGRPEERARAVAEQLGLRGLSNEHTRAAAAAIEDVLATRLEPGGLRLGDVPPERRLAELEFSLPVGAADHRLTAERLARALSVESAPWLRPSYLARVAELGFSAWQGYLRGFVDLVVEHEGRLWVLDYKSNYLGPSSDDYGPEALLAAMESHHYLLQGLLYALAVSRHAARRSVAGRAVPLGGVLYLFVRGMHPDAPERGVFRFSPSELLLASLASALGSSGPPPGAERGGA